jgi:hypothetical protein
MEDPDIRLSIMKTFSNQSFFSTKYPGKIFGFIVSDNMNEKDKKENSFIFKNKFRFVFSCSL